MAASNTVDVEHRVNSLHAYFLRPGRHGMPIVYSIDRIRDGKSFTTRRVVALQDGEAIFNLDASFHKEEPGGEFELPAPLDGVPSPEDLPLGRHGGMHRRPIETRELESGPRPTSTAAMWVRADGKLPDDFALTRACSLHVATADPVGAARRPLLGHSTGGCRRRSPPTMCSHRPVRADECCSTTSRRWPVRTPAVCPAGRCAHGRHLGVSITRNAHPPRAVGTRP